MAWIDYLSDIEDLEDAEFDAGLVARLESAAAGRAARPIRFSTPTFKEYETTELKGCGKNSFPAFSITAGACGLNCDHCQKKILEPMIPATNPEMLETKVRHLVATQGLSGFLLSGGSNKRNEINYMRYLPVVERLKSDFPEMRIAVHSALMKEQQARAMEAAGVDTVMMDVIGANETIERVYKLNRPVEDFEETAFARYHGARNGHAPEGAGYDMAYLGQHPLAGAAAGTLPIPRAGCVLRFEDRAAALDALGALTFTLPGDWREGVQAGPQVLSDGAILDTMLDVFTTEHMTETPSLPEPGTVSPASWKADWDKTRAARLGAGVTAEGALVFAAIEGNSSHFGGGAKASGATLRDLALLMRELGCSEALHLDGGGSTQVFGQAGGALIAPTDVHHGLMDRLARYDRPVPTWLCLDF